MSQTPTSHSESKHDKWREFIASLEPDIEPETIRLLDRYFRVAHTLRRVGENSLALSGLSFPKYRLLLELMYSETMEGDAELNPSEISRRHGTSRNTISSLIKDLENDGLVQRQLDQKDRRRFNIRLSGDGRDLVMQFSNRHFQTIASCFDGLTGHEKALLEELLQKLGDRAAEGVAVPA